MECQTWVLPLLHHPPFPMITTTKSSSWLVCNSYGNSIVLGRLRQSGVEATGKF